MMLGQEAPHDHHISVCQISAFNLPEDHRRLAEMFQLRGRALVQLGKAIEVINARKAIGTAPMPATEWKWFLTETDRLRRGCADLELPIAVEIMADKLTELTRRTRPLSWASASLEFVALTKVLLAELDKRVFLIVSPERARYWSPSVPSIIQQRFGSVSSELVQASVCIAVEAYTAAVFHLMRGLELGLGALARQFSVPHERENWQNIIESIESKIADLKRLPKGAQKTADQQFYSEAAKEFAYFKDAWRNHAAHSRVTYGFTDAVKVFVHVTDFMAHISTRLHE